MRYEENDTDEETLVEQGGSRGVEDGEDNEQEQDLMDGRGEPTEVREQVNDNQKVSSVGSSRDEIELSGINFKASYETSKIFWHIALTSLQHLRPCHSQYLKSVIAQIKPRS